MKNIFDEVSELYYRKNVKLSEARNLLERMREYSLVCPEDEKGKCALEINQLKESIEFKEFQLMFQHQRKLLKNAVKYYNLQENIKIELYENRADVIFNLFIYIDDFVVGISYKLISDDEKKNKLYINFYRNVNEEALDSFKFMLRKELIAKIFNFKTKRIKDDITYVTPVSFNNWGKTISEILKTINDNKRELVSILNKSCPFNDDGSHKYKFWRTKAKIEVTRRDNTDVIQGMKNGEVPSGSHVVGGNGSFRYWDKSDYVLKVELDCLACEKPIKYSCFVDVDTYLRELKEKMGWKNLRYDLLNSKLPSKVEVITYDMDKNPTERDFKPIEYNGSWLQLLKEAFKDL